MRLTWACGDDDVLYLYLAHICATWMPVSISSCTFFGLICLTSLRYTRRRLGFSTTLPSCTSISKLS